MNPEDKIQIEMTTLQAYCIYAIFGGTGGQKLGNLYDDLKAKLDPTGEIADKIAIESWEFYKDDNRIAELVNSVVFPKELEQQSEQQKKIRELEETINQAKVQIEELKKESN